MVKAHAAYTLHFVCFSLFFFFYALHKSNLCDDQRFWWHPPQLKAIPITDTSWKLWIEGGEGEGEEWRELPLAVGLRVLKFDSNGNARASCCCCCCCYYYYYYLYDICVRISTCDPRLDALWPRARVLHTFAAQIEIELRTLKVYGHNERELSSSLSCEAE